jgi:hypothetical protein
MAEIPARENFKNTKTSKTSQISLGPSFVDFLPEIRKLF